MRIGSFGIVFVVMIMLFIIGVGILALTNTSFEFGSYKTSQLTDWDTDTRTLVLFYTNFSPLAGILCTGYFLHTCSLPILRSAKNPEHNVRDLSWGYFLVFISYTLCGCMGYMGFIGYRFKDYYLTHTDPSLYGQIA